MISKKGSLKVELLSSTGGVEVDISVIVILFGKRQTIDVGRQARNGGKPEAIKVILPYQLTLRSYEALGTDRARTGSRLTADPAQKLIHPHISKSASRDHNYYLCLSCFNASSVIS